MEKTLARIGNIVPNQPNWSSTVTEEYTFLTAITESRDGSEKRDAMRQTARVDVQYLSDSVRAAQQRLFYDLNRFEGSGLWVVPVRWRNVRLENEAQAGDMVIRIATTAPWWLRAGTRLVLENDTTQEAVEVASRSGRDITLTAALSGTYSAAGLVMLAYSARYDSDNTLTATTTQHRQTTSRFSVDPGSAPIWQTDISGAAVHEGYPVFPARPDWSGKIQAKISDQRDTVDTGRGVIDVSRFRAASAYDFTMSFLGTTQARVDEIIGWFSHNQGRRGHFWMPTLTADITPVAQQAVGTMEMSVAGSEFFRAFESDDTLTTLAVTFNDGCVQYNRITSMAFDGTNTVLSFADPWERAVEVDLLVSFAFLCRFRDDNLVVNWTTSEVASTSISFRPLRNSWVPRKSVFAFPDWPLFYNANQSTDPIADPGNWLKIDLVAEGVPVAAIDRGECFFRHAQDIVISGTIDGCLVSGALRFYDEDNTQIVTAGGDAFAFNRSSGTAADGYYTAKTAGYDTGFKLLPPYDPTGAGGTAFTRPVRFIYLREFYSHYHSLVTLVSLTNSVEIKAPLWGFHNQVGNVACP